MNENDVALEIRLIQHAFSQNQRLNNGLSSWFERLIYMGFLYSQRIL